MLCHASADQAAIKWAYLEEMSEHYILVFSLAYVLGRQAELTQRHVFQPQEPAALSCGIPSTRENSDQRTPQQDKVRQSLFIGRSQAYTGGNGPRAAFEATKETCLGRLMQVDDAAARAMIIGQMLGPLDTKRADWIQDSSEILQRCSGWRGGGYSVVTGSWCDGDGLVRSGQGSVLSPRDETQLEGLRRSGAAGSMQQREH